MPEPRFDPRNREQRSFRGQNNFGPRLVLLRHRGDAKLRPRWLRNLIRRIITLLFQLITNRVAEWGTAISFHATLPARPLYHTIHPNADTRPALFFRPYWPIRVSQADVCWSANREDHCGVRFVPGRIGVACTLRISIWMRRLKIPVRVVGGAPRGQFFSFPALTASEANDNAEEFARTISRNTKRWFCTNRRLQGIPFRSNHQSESDARVRSQPYSPTSAESVWATASKRSGRFRLKNRFVASWLNPGFPAIQVSRHR